MTEEVTVRSARHWDEVRRTAVGAERAFDDRRPEGIFFHDRIVRAPALPLENTLCLFVDGRLAGALQVYERSVVVGGVPLTAAAIGNVFTLPEYRGEGYGARLLEATRAFLTEQGYPFSVLLSGHDGFYEGSGWRVCPSTVTTVADASAVPGAPSGTWRSFDPETDLDAVAEIYRDWVAHEGHFLRPRSLWEQWTFAPEKAVLDPDAVRVRVRDGRPVGYLVAREEDGRTDCLEVAFRAGTDRQAFAAACWNELADADARIGWHPPLPDSLRTALADDGASVSEITTDHCMMQVHDSRALDALVNVETTEQFVEHLADSDWYWSAVDAF